METITVEKVQLSKLLVDMETLIKDVEVLLDQDSIVKERLVEIKEDPSIGKSEEELDAYLKNRGVEVE